VAENKRISQILRDLAASRARVSRPTVGLVLERRCVGGPENVLAALWTGDGGAAASRPQDQGSKVKGNSM
jgi:hypothetical protein